MGQALKIERPFMFDIGRRRLALLGGIFLFRLLLDLSYVFIVSLLFEYSGLILNVSMEKVVESYILVILLGFFIPYNVKKPSDFLISIFFFCVIVPTLSFYGLRDETRYFLYVMLAGFVCVSVSRGWGASLRNRFYLKNAYKSTIVASCVGILLVFVWIVHQGGASNFNLNLMDVYKFRADVNATLHIGMFSYLNSWVFKVFNMTILAWALYRKKRFLSISALILQIIFFGLSSLKSVLFFPVLILFSYKVVERKNSILLFLSGLILLLFFCGIVFLFGNSDFESLFVRRVFFVPALLNFSYYEYFTQTGFLFMERLSSTTGFSSAEAIGRYAFGKSETWANAGFLATAYMNFGAVGVVVYSLIVGVLMRIADFLTDKRLSVWMGLSLVIVPFFLLLTSADLLTALLTHGLFLSLLILFLFSISFRPEGLNND